MDNGAVQRVNDADALRVGEEEMRRQLVNARHEAGLSQRSLAERMGSTQGVVSAIETGGKDCQLSTLHRYARALGGTLRVTIEMDGL